MGEIESEHEGITHGICDDCLNHYFPHHADKIRECLEVENIEDIFVDKKEQYPDTV